MLKVTPSIFIFSRHLIFFRFVSRTLFFPIWSIVDLFSLRFSPDTEENSSVERISKGCNQRKEKPLQDLDKIKAGTRLHPIQTCK